MEDLEVAKGYEVESEVSVDAQVEASNLETIHSEVNEEVEEIESIESK